MSATVRFLGIESPILKRLNDKYWLIEFRGMPAIYETSDQSVSAPYSPQFPLEVRISAMGAIAQIWEKRTKALQDLYDWGKQHAGPVGSNINYYNLLNLLTNAQFALRGKE